MRAVVAGQMAYHHHADGREELYDLAHDPQQRLDLTDFAEERDRLTRFRGWLATLAPPTGH